MGKQFVLQSEMSEQFLPTKSWQSFRNGNKSSTHFWYLSIASEQLKSDRVKLVEVRLTCSTGLRTLGERRKPPRAKLATTQMKAENIITLRSLRKFVKASHFVRWEFWAEDGALTSIDWISSYQSTRYSFKGTYKPFALSKRSKAF